MKTRPHLHVKRNWLQHIAWLMDCSVFEVLLMGAVIIYQIGLVVQLFMARR